MKVEAERAYHQRVLQILDHLEGEASDVYVMSSDCFRIIFWYQDCVMIVLCFLCNDR